MILCGEIRWADLGPPVGSQPAKRRPVLIVSADAYNRSRLATVLAVVLSSNTALAATPGNVFLPATATGLPRDSVANVTAVITLTKAEVERRAGLAPQSLMRQVEVGLRRVLGLARAI